MKKILSIAMVLMFIFGATMATKPVSGQEDTATSRMKLENVFSTCIGDKKGELAVDITTVADTDTVPKPDGGPSSYTVTSDGKIYVVDSYRDPSPIVEYAKNGRYVKTIDARSFTEDESGVSAVIANGEKLFVLTYGKTLCEYDTKSGEVTNYDIPDGVLHVSGRSMMTVGNCIAFTSYDEADTIWMFNTDTKTFVKANEKLSVKYNKDSKTSTVSFDGSVFELPSDETAEITPLGLDKDGNIIVEYILDGISYRTYTANGELVGYAEETYEDQAMYLCDISKVLNGELFRAKCDNETYSIDKVVFGEYVEHRAEKTFEDDHTHATRSLSFTEPNLFREEVLANADAMLNLTWTVKSTSNVTNTSTITVPEYFRGKKLRGAAVGTSFTGIPYCWGGMNGVSDAGTSEYLKSFISRINAGSCAGNVNCTGNYKSGSAGVDCSGFVALCYGMTTKRNTSWFKNSFGHTLSSYSDLQPGDYLVKVTADNGNHVMLVYQPASTIGGDILVAESTTRVSDSTGMKTNGTVKTWRPYSYYCNFTPKTAWHTWTINSDNVSSTCSGCSHNLGKRGDANNDSTVNSGDATRVMQYAADLVTLTYHEWVLADVNGDGVVNTGDSTNILRYLSDGSW